MRPAALADVCAEVRKLPLPLRPSSRAAERRWGTRARRLLVAAQVAELPGWALWLRRVLGDLEPDVVHAHFLDVWGGVAAIARARPLVVSVWGSDS
jgi:hypothetical protein